MSIENLNPRYEEYNQYLDNHISGVMRSWTELLKPRMTDWLLSKSKLITSEGIEKFLWETSKEIDKHDGTKYEDREYYAYLNYFYPSEGFEKDEEKFDRAWLYHQSRNKHHYQFWILIRDSGEIVPLDMPLMYICEMLCDWHSFSLRDSESTAYNWWNKNKDKMILSDNTRNTVESLIVYLKEPLK